MCSKKINIKLTAKEKIYCKDKEGNWIGVGVAIGAVIFALTKEPVWIALGVTVGAALCFKKKHNG
jgi:hypothetical protein